MNRSFPSPSPESRRDGVALVIVLGFLVLISGLIIAFFSSVSTELGSATSYAAGVSTKQLSDTATNLVIGQITDATQGYQNPSTPSTTTMLSWASQPGMIRNYDQSGKPYRFYKLYSAANMVMTNAANASAKAEFANDVPKNWSSQLGLYTDLNAPMLVPITSNDTDPTLPIITRNGVKYRAEYPIVDPSAQPPNGIVTSPPVPETIGGFSIDNTYLSGGNLSDPTQTPDSNPAAMPTRWLYVLKDGTVVSPSSATNGKVLFDTAPVKPNLNNPIVGRVAFWADDETCKVNINTASEGTFWDQPHGPSSIAYESGLGTFMPAQNEFQRFPGHTSMTCLSPLLESFNSNWKIPGSLKNYFSLAPRVEWGGSQGGTATPSATTGIATDNDRLFASIDELAYDVHYKQSTGGAPTRVRDTNITRAELEKLKFFVTANSRAPEVNLFNKPRICLWPLQANTTTISDPANAPLRNAKDRLIAFCTSTGQAGKSTYFPYYFQRYNVYYNGSSSSGDGRTSFVAPPPSCESTWEDFALSGTLYSVNSRNIQLYQYLRTLTSLNVPGFGGSFQTKYDKPNVYSDRDQILTEMYDMIRSGVNSYNTALAPKYDFAPTRNGGPAAGETQVVPAMIDGTGAGYNQATLANTYQAKITKGFGRFMTIPEIAVVFMNAAAAPGSPTNRIIKGSIIMETFNPTPGLASWSPHMRVMITGLSQFKLNNQMMGFPDYTPQTPIYPWNFSTARVGYVDGNHNTSIMGMIAQFHRYQADSSDPPKTVGNDGTENTYPFVTQPSSLNSLGGVSINPNDKTMQFSGGHIQIQISAGYENIPTNTGGVKPQQIVQILNVNFPAATLPIPTVASVPDMPARLSGDNKQGVYLVQTGDVVRSVQVPPDVVTGVTGSTSIPNAAQGDLRILAALPVVPEQMFTPHPYYNDPTKPYAHSLRDGGPNYLTGAATIKTASLIAGQTWSPEPVAARGQTRAANIAGIGDFDTPMGGMEDGCYINKPDEGNLATSGGYFGRGGFNVESGASYSPNRQVCSAVMFGSLPSGVKATEYALKQQQPGQAASVPGRPWQTLLFCPNPAAGPAHPGFGTSIAGQGAHYPPYQTPPDHLFLDLFTMPIVEPYAVSEPFSTAGKVNLNYQIAPFTYIKRTTGIRAVMRSVKVGADKTGDTNRAAFARYDVEMEPNNQGTLMGFENVFNRDDIFRSASQICDIFLVPKGAGAQYNSMSGWWNSYQHTGDNVREFPYGHIYPRVTTKSNTYTVHMRVQTLQKSNPKDATSATYWDETKDRVLGEYRGSNTIERYIDLPYTGDSTKDLPDFASTSNQTSIDVYYKFRTLSSKRFSP